MDFVNGRNEYHLRAVGEVMQPPIVPGNDDELRRLVDDKDKQIAELSRKLEAIESTQVTYVSMKESGNCPKCSSTRIFRWWKYSFKYQCRDCGFEETYKPTDTQNTIAVVVMLILGAVAVWWITSQ